MTYICKRLSIHQVVVELRKDECSNWSYPGATALAEYLYQLAEDTNEPIELDVVAIRCDFSEATLEEVQRSYPDIQSFDDLEQNTTVIRVDSETVIYQNY